MSKTISKAQVRRFWAIAKDSTESTDHRPARYTKRTALQMLRHKWEISEPEQIHRGRQYDQIIEDCRDPELAWKYRRDPNTRDMFEQLDEEPNANQ